MARTKSSLDQYLLFDAKSDWVPPEQLPDLSQETEVAIDTETKDPVLKEGNGPGFFKYERGNLNTGFIAGISLAWRDQKIYIPKRHDRVNYFSIDQLRPWLKALAAQDHTRFIFHNFGYDWGWIQAEFDLPPPKLIDDVSAMASMVDENRPSFSLDNLCRWRGIPGKDEEILREAAMLRGIPVDRIKEYMHEFPAKFVGPYGEQDAGSTLGLAGSLRPIIAAENMEAAYQIERDLMPITLKMKQRGIRVDKSRAEKLAADIKNRCEKDLYSLSESLGKKVEIKHLRASRWLQGQFDEMGLHYPRTGRSESYADGQASFEKSFMMNHAHWFPRTVYKIKHQYDLADKFLQKFIVNYSYKGRVHPTINQFRHEGGGARSHRFSYADPPLQQMPSRDDEWAPLIRSCFIPEDGEKWVSIDYRQQEYRLIVFVAELLRAKGAQKAADMYRQNPDTDFHNYVSEITRLPRRRAKDVNFAKAYGAGVRKFALMTGMSEDESQTTMEQYDTELPFVKIASDRYVRYASNHGFIKLIDGARNHFNLWEPVYRDFAKEYEAKKKNPKIDTTPCYEDEYNRRHDDPEHPWYWEKKKRAYTHKAFNRMIQGSAARQMKKAMVDIDRAGYGMLLQLHDELGFSFSDAKDAFACAKLMEEALPVITIPMSADVEWGDSWGNLEKINSSGGL